MFLPLYVICRVQISLAQKLGVASIFSIVLLTIALDILRTIGSLPEGIYSHSIMYTILEVTLAVMVSCLPTYRGLFVVKRRMKSVRSGRMTTSHTKHAADGPEGNSNMAGKTKTDRTQATLLTARGLFKAYPLESLESIKQPKPVVYNTSSSKGYISR